MAALLLQVAKPPQPPRSARRRMLSHTTNASSFLARAPGLRPGGFPRGESGGGFFATPPSKNLPPQPFHHEIDGLTDRDETPACQGPRASSASLCNVVALHGLNHGEDMPAKSLPPSERLLDRRRVEAEQRISAAIDEELRAASVKELARAAEVSEARIKQMRAAGADPKLSTGILMAQRCPKLRALLMDLLTAECGDGDRSPAQILDELARARWRR